MLTPTQRRRRNAMRKAKRDHRALIALLGGRCHVCDDDGSAAPLSIGHKVPRTWNIRKLRYDARIKKYYQEFFAGIVLLVECLACNTSEMRSRRRAEALLPEAPF